MSSSNFSVFETIIYGHPLCEGWTNNTEGAIYHLGNTILFLGYMGGSGAYGALYIFSFLAPAFMCLALWGWLSVCGLDVFLWNALLMLLCLAQVCHLIFRLMRDGVAKEELSSLYSAVYQPLDVPVQVFKEITDACENKVLSLKAEETYAVEGKTPIDRLSFLLSGRQNGALVKCEVMPGLPMSAWGCSCTLVTFHLCLSHVSRRTGYCQWPLNALNPPQRIRVSLEGQFLHYIFPHQFLDSPEWESLRPTEEGNFQVTLTAEMDCQYISFRRRRLYLLLAKDRYVARLFSVMLGNDIADKLYSLNDKLFAKSGVRLDIRLPSLYHVLAPSPPSSEGGSASSPHRGSQGNQTVVPMDSIPANQHVDSAVSKRGPGKDPHLKVPASQQPSMWPSDTEMPSGEDSTSLVLEDFADMIGSLVDYGSERDYLK